MEVAMTSKLMKFHYLFHYVAYYIAWVAGIYCAALGHNSLAVSIVLGITGIQVAWQFTVAKRTQGIFLLIGIFTLGGFLIDTLFLRTGLVVFYANPFQTIMSPPWMISLWVSFAVAYYALMEPLWRRYALLGGMSFMAFPLAYLAGIKLGAGEFPYGVYSSLAYGVVWAFLLPACDYIFLKLSHLQK